MQKPNIINYFYCSFISESTRWLLTHGKYEEIRIILKKLAKRNGRKEPDLTILDEVIANELAIRQKQKKYTYLSLLKFRSTRLKIPLFSFMWWVSFISYLSLVFNWFKLGQKNITFVSNPQSFLNDITILC